MIFFYLLLFKIFEIEFNFKKWQRVAIKSLLKKSVEKGSIVNFLK